MRFLSTHISCLCRLLLLLLPALVVVSACDKDSAAGAEGEPEYNTYLQITLHTGSMVPATRGPQGGENGDGNLTAIERECAVYNATILLYKDANGINGNDGTKQAGGNPADNYTRIYYHPVTGEYIPGGWLYYMNPNSPWSVNFNYSYNYSRSYQYSNGQIITNHRHTQTLGISGNVKITPALSINLTTGFDIMALKLTTTQLSATYDLHCFNISVSWVPTGQWQSWSFRIAANAAALADLLRFKKSSR